MQANPVREDYGMKFKRLSVPKGQWVREYRLHRDFRCWKDYKYREKQYKKEEMN